MLVGGGNDAGINLNGRQAADPVELAIGQDAQQAGLQIRRHVADLIEEQGAAVGLLETSLAPRLGASEGTAFVTEQFGLQQVVGDGRHVQGDEGLVGAWAMPMQGVRHQFLTGTRLAIDQYRNLGAGQAADGPEDLLHGRGLTDDLGATGHGFRRGGGLPHLMAASTADLGDGLIEIEGLRQILEGAAMKGGYSTVQV